MPKEDMLVVDIDRQPNVQETKVDGAEKFSALSWLCHHAGQMAKGSIALLGLLALGGLGYYFGRRQSASSSASSVSNALEVAADFSSALANEATPTPISFISDAAASKPLDLVYAESAENDDKKIDFGNKEESHKNTQEQSSVRVETQNTATTDDETKELVVNGTIQDQLLEVGHPWSATINMTALFGENATLTQFSSPALSDWLQASVKLIPPGVPGFDAQGVTVQGNLAYVAAGCQSYPCIEGEGGLKIIDVSDSTHPFEKSSVPGFWTLGVTVQGSLAYVADYYNGLKIINVSDSSDPFVESEMSGFRAYGVTVQGNLAYVAANNQGLKIIDVSNSSHPFVIEPGVPGFNARGVTVQSNLAYVAGDRLKIIDVSNSSHPVVIEPGVPGFTAWSVTVQGSLAYIAVGFYPCGLEIVDVSNSTHPCIKSSVTGFGAQDVFVQSNLAYVAAGHAGLKIIDISNISNPFVIEPGVPGFTAWSVTVQGNLAYVAAGHAGLKIIDLSQWQLSGSPMQSKCTYQFVISSESLLHGNATKTFTIKTDNFPYVVGAIPNQSLYPKNSLSLAVRLTKVFADEDKEDTLFPSINSEPQQDWLSFVVKSFFIARRANFYADARDVFIHGNLAYVAAYDKALKIIDITDNSNPKIIEPGVIGFFSYGVTVQSNLAYVAALEGLKIIDISNSSHPVIIEPGLPEFDAHDVTIQGNLVYGVAGCESYETCVKGGLKIIDVSNSSHPFVIEPGVPGFYASGVTVQGNLAYVACGWNYELKIYDGLKIIDVNNSSHPFEKSSVTGLDAQGVTVQGNLAYVAAWHQGLKIIDVSNSSHPVVIEPGVTGFLAYGVTVQGNLAYVVTGRNQGLKIIDVSKPNNPIIVGELSSATIAATAVLPANKLCVVGENVFGILDLTNYQFSGVPTEKDVENYNIKVTAADSFGAETYTNFTIRVEGGPRLSPNVTIPPRIALVGQPANFFLDQDTFEDPNNDVITYTAKLANGEKLPYFLDFNPSSATFFGIPANSDKGNYFVTIFASDRIVTPPTAENFVLAVQDTIPEQTFIVGRDGEKSLSIPGDTPFEGRSLVYNIKPRSNETWPNWLHFDAPNRKLFGTPSAADVGITSMQVTLNDGYGDAFVLFSLEVKENAVPHLKSMIPVQNVKAGDSFPFTFNPDTFADDDNDPLRYSANLEAAASWLKFNPETRTFSGTPSGWTDAYIYATRKYTITITAFDLSNATAIGTFELNLNGPSSWEKFLTAGMVIFGALATSYGYTHKKHLLWDFFKKDRYVKPRELLVVGDTEFSHKINFPAEHIKSIIVTTSRDRLCARKMPSCFKQTLGFFPLLESAVSDIKERVFPCGGVSAYLFPWLFYDSKANTLKSIEGGPTEEFIGKDIKIQVRGTDNRIMEEFQIKIVSEQNEIGEIADEADRARRKTRVRPRMVSMTEYKVTELKAPLISPIADISLKF